ncbi:MAG: Uma2 family endonuclease [Acidimicrobiales bacterium]
MKTVVLGPRPEELESLIARRHALGLDTHDEVWEGTYHVAPAAHPIHGYVDHALAVLLDPYAKAAGLVATGPFNLGSRDDYRVPDQGYHRDLPYTVWVPAVVMVVEVVSPDDETYDKFGFYADHGVEEILVADPAARTVRCFRRSDAGFAETAATDVLGIGVDDIGGRIDWPVVEAPAGT